MLYNRIVTETDPNKFHNLQEQIFACSIFAIKVKIFRIFLLLSFFFVL